MQISLLDTNVFYLLLVSSETNELLLLYFMIHKLIYVDH